MQKNCKNFVKVSPIMETLTGIMIALLIFYSGKLIIKGEIGITFFFFSSDDAPINLLDR